MVGKGIDPFTATDPQSQAFQKSVNRLDAKAKTSQQLKAYYDEQRSMVQGKEDQYEGYQEMEDFFQNNSLDDILKNQLSPPSITKAIPNLDLAPFYSDMVNEGIDANNGIPLDSKQISDMIDFRLNNPSDAAQLIKTYESKSKQIQKADPTEWKNIQARATLYSNGDVMKQMMTEDAERYNKRTYTVEQMVDDVASELRPKSTKIGKGTITTASSEVSEKAIKNRIRLKLQSDPRTMDMTPGATIDEKVDNFFNDNKEAIRGSISGRKYERTEDKTGNAFGFSRQQREDNFNQWYGQFKKGYQQASDFLVGSSLPGEGLTITKTEPGPQQADGSVKDVKVYLKGPDIRKLQDIAAKTGNSSDDFLAKFLSEDEPDQEEMDQLPPTVQEQIKDLANTLGRGTYVESEGSLMRVYDLTNEKDQELLRTSYKTAFQKKKDLYLEVDEKTQKPGGSSMIPTQNGPFLPSKMKKQ